MENIDKIKLQHITLIEEYKNLRSEIEIRLELLDKVVNYEILLIVGVVAASFQLLIGRIDNKDSILEYLFLLAPFPFCALGCAYSIHNLFILKIAKYIHQVIRPQINTLLKSEIALIDYETYAGKEIWSNQQWSSRIVKKLLALLWSVLIPCICMVGYLFVISNKLTFSNVKDLGIPANVDKTQLFLFFLSLICIFFTVILSLKCAGESKTFNKIPSKIKK